MCRERHDAGNAEQQREEPVAHLEHVGVAAEQRGGDDAEREADEHGNPDDVDRSLADELDEDLADGEAAGDDQCLGIARHVPADDEIDPDREGGAEEQAGEVLADGRDPRLPGRDRVRVAGPAAVRCPRVPPVPSLQGTAEDSGISRVTLVS
jgi:hypothetical protein